MPNNLGGRIQEGFATDLEREMARKITMAIDKWRKGIKIETAQRRWLFELIQNALDVAKSTKNSEVEIEISRRSDGMAIRHNAGHFFPKEIRALIYAYSSKPYDRSSEFAGKFATGFLVTHIASPVVDVKGLLQEDGHFYEFHTVLDRKSNDIDTLVAGFSESFRQLDEARETQDVHRGCWTEYSYAISDPIGENAVRVGLLEIEKCLPFLFAFNRDLAAITIDGKRYGRHSNSVRFQSDPCSAPTPITEAISAFLGGFGDAEIAVLLDTRTNSLQDMSGIPGIYVKGLPLIETADYIRVPFAIHSTSFSTLEERDALADETGNSQIIDDAFHSYLSLVNNIANSPNRGLRSLYRLADFEAIADDKKEQNEMLCYLDTKIGDAVKTIVNEIPLVEVGDGRERITDVVFPLKTFKSNELGSDLFPSFCALLHATGKDLPHDDELSPWVDLAVKIGAQFGHLVHLDLYEVGTLRQELAEYVKRKSDQSDCPDLGVFGTRFSLADAKAFLVSLLSLANELYKSGMVDPNFANYLLLNQGGTVGPLSWDDGSISIDDGIPEDFKDLVEAIGWQIRKELVDNSLAGLEIVQDLVRDRKDVSKALDFLVQSEFQPDDSTEDPSGWPTELKAWVGLVRWCILNRSVREGLAIVTKGGKIERLADPKDETFLIPFLQMGVEHKFEDLYPENRILHPKYFEDVESEGLLLALKEQTAFVTSLPVYRSKARLAHEKLTSICNDSDVVAKGDHIIALNDGTISFLPFWNELIGRIGTNEQRSMLLFEFAVLHLANKDNNWLVHKQVSCSTCGAAQHNVLPSQWLASLKTDAWIPVRIMENQQAKVVRREATREGIQNLFPGDAIGKLIASNPENAIRLLPHFGFDELDLKLTIESRRRNVPEEAVRKQVSLLVDISKHVPNLAYVAEHAPDALKAAVEKLKSDIDAQPAKDENKTIGQNVEQIMAEAIQERGLKVRVIYKGGDLEFWPEQEGWDSGQIQIGIYTAEIKFTTGSRVRITKQQSLMARDRKEKYLLLVVESGSDLREQLKSPNLHRQVIAGLLDEVTSNSHVVENIHLKLGDIPDPTEVEPDINGYWVKKKLWQKKQGITSWLRKNFP